MPTTLTRRAAIVGTAVSVGAVAAVAVPAFGHGDDDCIKLVDEAALLDSLIAAYHRAYQAFEVVFDAEDHGEATEQESEAALDRFDDTLIALCAVRLVDPDARRARREFLAAKLVPATYCNEGLMQAVYDALLA